MHIKRFNQEGIAVGKTFRHDGKTYRCQAVTRDNGCRGCAFDAKGENTCDMLPYSCVAYSRLDNTNVIFVEV